jgi:hypothetical protein
MDLTITVVSDVICPWCWIGKRRLEKALSSLAPGTVARVVWEPFELNSNMPVAGMDRRQYRSAKFGSWERARAMDAQVAAVGRTEGLDYRFEQITRTPNTHDAHRLIWLGERLGRQDAMVEALFAAYFRDGLDIGKRLRPWQQKSGSNAIRLPISCPVTKEIRRCNYSRTSTHDVDFRECRHSSCEADPSQAVHKSPTSL